MSKITMYEGINNSPQTTLTAQITAAAQTIPVASTAALPAAPNLATIGTGDDAEVIQYNGAEDGVLTGCVRGFNGTTAKVWAAETVVFRGFTLSDYDALRGNIDDLYSAKLDAAGDGSEVTAEFTAASARENLASGDTLGKAFGKLAKAYSDLKPIAWSGAYTDLSGTAHASTHKLGGADALAAADIGAAAASHTHDQGDISGLADALAAKQDAIALTKSRAVITNASGALAVSAVTSTELGYLDGVTSNVQTQLNAKQPTVTVSGLLKGTGSGVAAATAGVDYAAASHTQAITSITGLETALEGKQPKKITQTNVSVATSAWADDSTYSDYPKAATVSISGVTADMVPEVVFAPGDATSGNYAPVAVCVANGVKIFAAETPEAAITLLTIVVWG